MRLFPNSSPIRRNVHPAQAFIEFALILPVMLLMIFGLIDLGRAFVFGVAVQEGTRQAARVAASSNYSTAVPVSNSDVLGRLIAGSNPALNGCLAQTTTQTCNGGSWTLSVSVLSSAGTTYHSVDAARTANALPGAQVTVTAAGSVALLSGLSTGAFGLTLPQIGVHGESAMVIL